MLLNELSRLGQLYKVVSKTPEQFTHDADGNLTSDGRWTYSWDSENRLIAMQTTTNALPSGVPNVKLAYAYDGQSRRIGKTVYTNAAGSWVQTSAATFLYDGWNLVTEISNQATQTATNHYVWGLDLSGSAQGAGGIGGLLATVHSGDPEPVEGFFCYDGNGNVMVLVDAATGNESARYEYGPFGEVIRASGAMAEVNPFRFSTKYEDAETGLLYYGYRYYQPGTGRWVSRDPIGEEGGGNVYVAFADSPFDNVDALGLSTISYHVVVGSLIWWPTGTWGQPWWAASGESGENWSEVTVRSRNAPLGSCNSVITWTDPGGVNAGKVQAFFKAKCPRQYRLKITVTMIAEGTGEIGHASVRYSDISGNLLAADGTTDAPYAETRVFHIVVDITGETVGQNVEVGTYTPTLRFVQRSDPNTGTAFGSLEVVEE